MGSSADAFFFTTGADGRGYGHAWKVWAHDTSFYVMGRHQGIDQIKVSLHGPRDASSDPWLKMGQARKFADSETSNVDVRGQLPFTFRGENVADGVRRVLRVRTTWDLFDSDLLGLGYQKRTSGRRLRLEVPPPGYASDVDFFLSDGKPFIPGDTLARNALVGQLRNDAGQALTAICVRRALDRVPTPGDFERYRPWGRPDRARGVLAWGGSGVLPWFVEIEVSMSRIARKEPINRLKPPLYAAAREGLTFERPFELDHPVRTPFGLGIED